MNKKPNAKELLATMGAIAESNVIGNLIDDTINSKKTDKIERLRLKAERNRIIQDKKLYAKRR